MNTKKLLWQSIGLIFVALLAGCGTAQDEPIAIATAVPPTASPTAAALTATPMPPPPTATLTPVPSTPTPVKVPPEAIQGFLIDANVDEPMAGEFTVIVGWDWEEGRGPCGMSGNMLFIGGKPEGSLTIAGDGEFVIQEVGPVSVDKNMAFGAMEAGQPLMMAICGGALENTAVIQTEAGEAVVFAFEEGEGVYLGKVYVTP